MKLKFGLVSNDSCPPKHQNRHLETKHTHLKDMSEDFFKRKKDEMADQSKVLKSKSLRPPN